MGDCIAQDRIRTRTPEKEVVYSETKEWGRNQTDKRPLAAAVQGQAAAPKKSHTGDGKNR